MSSIREFAKNATLAVAHRLCKDASFIPDERMDWRPMEHGKSALQILSECTSTNLRIADAIKGDAPRAVAEITDLEDLRAHLIASASEVCDAIDSMRDSSDMLQLPWGATMSATEAIMLPANHMQYHDGQINYIQLLLGDTTFHWAED
jgi:uncharacterized damage-inducible protein DinB